MNEQLVTQLEELGLSQKEARVYVASLMLGPSTVQKIADFSGIKRVTTYVILESLVNLGLASQSSKGKKTFFSAEEPNNLRRLLQKKEEQLKEQKQSFEDMLPELKSLRSLPADTPAVKFYEGVEGIRSILTWVYAEANKNNDTIYGISNMDSVFKLFPEIRDNLGNPQRISESLPSRIIYTYSGGPIFKETDKARNRQSRYLPADKYKLHADFSVAGDHIMMISLAGVTPIGISISSSELADGLREIFRIMWEAAAPYNK